MNTDLRVLIVEDSAADAELIMHKLSETGSHLVYELVDTAHDTRRALGEKRWDVILCDYYMPNIDPYVVLDILRETESDIPLIVISGKIGEEEAVKLLKAGCHDCVMKSDLRRLPDVINRETKEAVVREENRALVRKLNKYQILCDAAKDIMLFMDAAGNILDANTAAINCYGYSFEEFLTKNIMDLRHISNQGVVKAQMETAVAGNVFFEAIHYRKDNTPFFAEVSSQGILLDGQNLIFSIVRDITERKQIEGQREQYLKDLLESQRIAHIGTWRLDVETNQVVWSDELYKMYDFDSSVPPPPYTEHMKLFTPESWEKLSTALELTRTSGIPYELELETTKTDGSNGWMWTRGEADRNSMGNIVSLWGTAQDITRYKRNEADLQSERNMAQAYLETAAVMIMALDKDGKVSLINTEGCGILKAAKESILGKNWFDSFVPVSAKESVKQVFDKIIAGGIITEQYHENSVITADGEERIILWHNNPLRDTAGNITGVLSSGIDITERKQTEKALVESENLFRTAFENATVGIVMLEKNGRYIKANDKACKLLGYTREELLQLHFNDITYEEDKGIGTDLVKKMISGEINSAAFEKRYINKDGTVIWALVSTAAIRDEMNKLKFFLNYIQDITNSKATTERINSVLEGTIETLALVVEARDPYTSGHQKRVAEIAVAIAENLGLSKGQVRGLYLASIIHDLGKIQVPSEILSKPGKLTNLEFELIKCHPETGYNLLRDIDFPWPVAEIIYQHQERIDGSGYPRKLKGDSMLIEAKILVVADVFEAMSSHRPYRAAFSKDIALAELKKNKGILYDPDVVEACIRVLENK